MQSPTGLTDRSTVSTEPVHDETSSNGNKEDEDDDDDESEDKMDTQQHDPERLKSFNVSVQVFCMKSYIVGLMLHKCTGRITMSWMIKLYMGDRKFELSHVTHAPPSLYKKCTE